MNLPDCLCGKNKWGSADGTLAQPFSKMYFICEDCHRSGLYLRAQQNAVFTAFLTVQEPGGCLDLQYVEDLLLPQWEDLDRQAGEVGDGHPPVVPPPPVPDGQALFVGNDHAEWERVNQSTSAPVAAP